MRSPIFLFLLPLVVFGQFLDRPNVVLFMADDMGMGDSSAYQFFTGNSDGQQIHTPAMQKLANMGILFTDAHTPSITVSAALVSTREDMRHGFATKIWRTNGWKNPRIGLGKIKTSPFSFFSPLMTCMFLAFPMSAFGEPQP